MTARGAILLGLAGLALATPAAGADGGPSPGVMLGYRGVHRAGDAVRYVALPAGTDTLLATVSVQGGEVQGFRLLAGSYGIPAVAFDGTTGGLSGDGRRLVLARGLSPGTLPSHSRFVVIDTRLRKPQTLVVPGAHAFDALSPDGATLFTIQYRSAGDPNDYAVRAYDVARRRLLPQPIVDPREPEEPMRGTPLHRVTSRDGRFVYTLYGSDSTRPFVHALDTVKRTAACLDLPWHGDTQALWKLQLRLVDGERQLLLQQGSATAASIDLGSRRVHAAATAADTL